MIFDGFLQRKLASLLRPWLSQEPVYEVKLGFFRSVIVIRDIRFDADILNGLIDGGTALRLLFKSVVIDEVVIRVSHWSAPAFAIDVRGVNVSLFVERGAVSKRVDESFDDYLENRKRSILAQIDPQGSALHESIERMMMTASLKTGIKDSITNLVLAHCCLHFHDARVRVEYPVSDDTFSWLCYSRELSVDSSHEKIGCLFGGIIGLLFVPFRETSFNLEASELDLGAETKAHSSCVLSFINPCVGIRMKDLHLVNLVLSVPEINFSPSSSQLQMVQAFSNLLSIECKHIRSGRLLWKIVRYNIHHVLRCPKYAVYKMVLDALVWLHLVKEYQTLLSLVGYPEHRPRIKTGMKFFRAADQQWQRISQKEKTGLPVEAVASARRVARHRAARKAPCDEIFDVPYVNNDFSIFWRIFLPLLVLWRVTLDSFENFWTFVLLRMTPSIVDRSKMTSTVVDPKCCFHLSLGKVSATFSLNDGCPISRKTNLKERTSKTDLISFFLVAKEFLLSYEEGICEQYISFSVGSLKITSAAVSHDSKNKTRLGNNHDLRQNTKENQAGSKAIAWGEPALISCHSEIGDIEHGDLPDLKELSGEIGLAWNRMKSRFQGSKRGDKGNPWAICSIHTSLSYQGIKGSHPVVLKCNFMVGKLNFALDYSAVISIAALREQMQYALCQVNGSLGSTRNIRDIQKINLQRINSPDTLTSLIEGLKIKLFNLLPDNHIEVNGVVAGPRVQISLKNEGFAGSPSERNALRVPEVINFKIDVYSSYFAVQPTAMSTIAPGEHQTPSDGFESELSKMQDNMMGGFHVSGNVEYVSRGQISHLYYLRLGGLSAYLENSLEDDQMQVLLLKPVTAKFPTIRDYFYSFGRSLVASSLSLHGVMSGATGLFYMDELSVISQVVESLFTAALVPASSSSTSEDVQNNHAMLENQILQPVFLNEEIHSGSSEGETLTLESELFSIRASVELVPFDIILHNSRNVAEKSFFPLLLDNSNFQMRELAEPSSTGIGLSVQRSGLNIFVGEAKIEIDANVGGFRAVLFKHNDQTGNTDISGTKDVILHSVDCLYEASLSSCSFILLLDCVHDSKSMNEAYSATSNNNPKDLVAGHPLMANSRLPNFDHSIDDGVESDVSDVALSYWLILNITIGVIFVGSVSVKNDVLDSNVVDNLQLSVSVGGEFQSFLMEIQGGLIVIDVLVLVRFSHCLRSYLNFIKTLLSMEHSHRKSRRMAEPSVNESVGIEHSEEPAQANSSPAYTVKWELLEACRIDLSHFSLALLSQDDSGLLRQIIGRVNFISKLRSKDRKQKFLFNLSHLEILSQNLYYGVKGRERNNQMPHFSSVGSSSKPLLSNRDSSSGTILLKEKVLALSEDASSSKPPLSMDGSSAIDSSPPTVQTSKNSILDRLTTSISAEKLFSGFEDNQSCLTQGWVGRGSISGLNLTISLSEIKILMAVIESLSEVSGKDDANNVLEKTWSSADQIFENDLETALPEGAIVAIQDAHQHMYVSVENVENKYRVAGAVHYSAVGRGALFRVKWQKQKRWMFSTPWFSLESLSAKTASGDPLRLNYSAPSSFIDISSSNDSACALWKIASHKHEGYQDDTDLRPLSYLTRNTFYLVNKKSDCAAAFIHGAFEFVKKPGNLFKFKIFSGLSLTHVILPSESPSAMEAQSIPDQIHTVPCISLTVEKVSLTVVHELSDARDNIPLLQVTTDDTELTVQVLPQKTRLISTFTTMLYYFDAFNFIWKELTQPIEICMYWRSTTHSTVEEKSSHGMHSRLYVRLQELDLSLTELSLDILLYLIGKLDLAGPFAVKSSSILANCCKVANQLDVDLLCHFDNSQPARVGRNLSADFFLRHLVDQPLEASCAMVYLEIPGTSSTSSIRVPLVKTQVFAWRTRIKSLQDTQTHPGPFIVFDISKNVEEGLSLTISPLLRIHNQTGFSVELRIQRAGSTEVESASVLLKDGDTVDDCVAAFDAISLVGGPKKALRSLGVGNFVFSFRPEIKELTKHSCSSTSVDWSDNLEGGKAVRLSGVIDKFSYQFRKALSVDLRKYNFSTTGCLVNSGNAHVANMHFLVQRIVREVPIMQPNDHLKSKISPIAFQEQKEIILLPTVRVSNLLESDINVLLSEAENSSADGLLNINQATIPSGLTVNLYANPAVIFFTITLTMFGSSCKPVNCGQWLKKLNKKKDGIQFLDIDLDFCRGQYFACLRLARSEKGMLEAIVFTRYSLRNDYECPLLCSTTNLKPLPRDQTDRHSTTTPPHLGSFLPPKSIRSWYMKSSMVSMTLFDEESSESTLDLDALSGRSEMSFTKLQGSGFVQSVKLGISLGPLTNQFNVPAQVVSLVPRYIVSNESAERIFVRQCFLEDDLVETLNISSKQKKTLSLRVGSGDKRDITVFDKLLRKHKVSDDDFSMFVQFRPNESMLGWSGPVCVASLGRFFVKFKRSVDSSVHQSAHSTREDDTTWEYGAVHVVEETSTFVLNFYKPPDISLPYRIENHLCDASINYYQKDTFEPETLASRGSVYYVWDDLTRPRKLVVKINGVEMLREISLDKLRPWKPFLRSRQQREQASMLPSYSHIYRGTNVPMKGINVEKLGYEVHADGLTRVLRICHWPGSHVGGKNFHSSKMVQLRVSYFAIRLLERFKRDVAEDADSSDMSTYTPIIIGRLVNISLDSIILDERKYNQCRVQSLSVDEKWAGAPYAAMLRRHFTSVYDADDSILFVVFVLYSTSSTVREVKYSSILLQPIDLNLDEETLMKIVPFWRTSLSTNTQSQQYYFDHFEVHPVKIIASFLPEDSYSSYSSGQETLRSLLHSVIKIPPVKNLVVELNGVLVTHALVTTRELLLRCGRHYSWYAMRAIYIAKGSRLLPPAFASVFDDLASSSLDVFFDPSSSLFNVRGLTLGTFKLISKSIENKGISGTRRYFGDLGKTLKNAGSNILFAAVTEVTDSVVRGAENSGLNGMVTGFHYGVLKLAMEPSVLGTAFLEGGPDRKIKLDRSPGIDELYIEGYLQAMLDAIYKQEYLRVRVIDDQVILKNLPPNSSLIDEIMDRIKDFLVSKALLKGEYSAMARPLRHLRGDNEWRIGPTILTLCEHLFVSFAIRMLRKQTNITVGKLKLKEKWAGGGEEKKPSSSTGEPTRKSIWRWGIGKFILSAALAYIDGRLCRGIPNPVARRIVSGFLLSLLDNDDTK